MVDLLLCHSSHSRLLDLWLPLLLQLNIRIVSLRVVKPLEAVVLRWWVGSVLVFTVVHLVVLVIVDVILHHFYC